MFARSLAFTPVVLLTACVGPPPTDRFAAEVEAGTAWISRNDAAVPGDTGTRVALDELTGSGPAAVGRGYLTWRPAGRHELRALVAPLSVSGTGEIDGPVDFAGASYAAGVPTRAKYRFDSYRLTWRYRLLDDEALQGFIGFTGKIRDAEIELSQGGTSSRKTDTGFVPLLHVAGDWHIADGWRLSLDVDGSWAPQGRALDASLKAYVDLTDDLALGFGYRTIEGGADNDEVYTFAWVHQAVISLRYDF
jgi:hypothetical protein